MEQLSLNGEPKTGTTKPAAATAPATAAPALPGGPESAAMPAGNDATALAAVCWAAGVLLAQAPAQVSSLRVRCGEVAVDMEWPAPPAVADPAAPSPPTDSAPPTDPAAPATNQSGRPPETPDLAYVRAPMVGTFYHAPSPETPPFVKPGDVVEAGQQVGIVEAMKLMNAIEAERPGRVVEILVANGSAVEFDQPLVAVAPLQAGGSVEEELLCSPPY